MVGTVEDGTRHAVEAWLKWLPTWRLGTHRVQVRACRRCMGSPILISAGLDIDIPHSVQHAFTMRIKHVIDSVVDVYVAKNLPNLEREMRSAEERKARRPYRATEGLDPEFLGLPIDPEPQATHPFLFTLAGLEAEIGAEAEAESDIEEVRQFTSEVREALRVEVKFADDFAGLMGRRICAEVSQQKNLIVASVERYVEPQIRELLSALELTLDTPGALAR